MSRYLEFVFPFVFSVLIFFSFSFPNAQNSIRYSISDKSKIEVLGKTNINRFCCASYEKFKPQTLEYKITDGSDFIRFQGADLNIQINEMDCGGWLINKDFRTTLNADDHPFIKIILKDVINQDCNNLTECDNWIFFIANTEININQIKKSIPIPIHVLKKSDKKFKVTGQKELHLSDFKIIPPTALMGAIKVKNSIEIQFEIEINLI